ncbi:hypothetical protein HHK36_015161 [Tetracentron sinense]|uniref:WAT1-related protein n=1 Tax=Tetracentron sinense TaxID=13715 RepID=A0A834Z5M1_TETSI|nr:hypothetical protein HHK36_015161 [Tetracentron sinense]
MEVKSSLWRLMPYAAMVGVECLDVGMTTLSKAAMSRGMSHFLFVFYSNAFATVILLPPSFILHRKDRPPLTFSLISRFFLLALIGITVVQNSVYTGINYSSPTLGSAMGNLVPAFTFMLAIIFRMEKVHLRSSRSQVRIMGTLVSISGALVVTFYKGPSIWAWPTPSPSISPANLLQSQPSLPNSLTEANNWILGGLFLAIACLSVSIWNILQAATVKEYPAEMIIVSFYCFFGTIQCLVVSLIAERDPNAWTLSPDMQLISILYSAVFGGVLTPCVCTWCIRKKGPVFVAMFKPLGIAIAALMGVIFLGDTLHFGSVVGAIIIVVGFYGVIWGQSKEVIKGEINEVDIDSEVAPFLQNHREV